MFYERASQFPKMAKKDFPYMVESEFNFAYLATVSASSLWKQDGGQFYIARKRVSILVVKDFKTVLPRRLWIAKLNGLVSVSKVSYFSCIIANKSTQLLLITCHM